MKIAITIQGDDSTSVVDPRFGRAENFLIYNQEDSSWTCLPNAQNLEAAHGAGIQAGQTIAQSGAKILLTGHVGPKAFKVLAAEGIAIYSFGDQTKTALEVLADFQAGKLSEISTPSAPHK